MILTQDEIVLILKTLKESDFDELELTMDSFSLRARRKGASILPHTESVRTSHASTDSVEADAPIVEQLESPAPSEKPIPEEAAGKEEGLVSIKAPILGTFYRRSSPKDAPFVEVGSIVKEDDTVCLLEVMKVFSTVKAGIRGQIREICVENGEMVEFNQVLFLVQLLEADQEQETD